MMLERIYSAKQVKLALLKDAGLGMCETRHHDPLNCNHFRITRHQAHYTWPLASKHKHPVVKLVWPVC